MLSLLLAAAGMLGLSGHPAAHADESTPNVEAYANAPGWITVAWTSDASASEYTLQRQDNPSVQQVEGSGTFTDTGLKAATSYSYRVCGDSDCSAWVTARTLAASGSGTPGAPPPPSQRPSDYCCALLGLTLTDRSETSLTVTWNGPRDVNPDPGVDIGDSVEIICLDLKVGDQCNGSTHDGGSVHQMRAAAYL